jgi:hypothetical protein
MPNDDNFDVILAIPCDKLRRALDVSAVVSSSLETFSDNPVQCGGTELAIKNVAHDNNSKVRELAEIFCEQIEEHGAYELIFNDLNDKNSNISTKRTPLAFGQVILYEDKKNIKFIPRSCYNFFCVLSELTVNRDSFYIIYFVVPDINYQDLTLLMDQSHELWCNINGNADSHLVLADYLHESGYKHFGKIYRIVFSDSNQFKIITGNENKAKLFNILAAEEYKSTELFSHQIELSENTKEKFFDDYNMYCSYKAYASIYSYYYVINDEDKDIFSKRIAPDETDEGFSSEANILFVLETELFKITACLALSKKINEQIHNPDMREIQKMFKSFINTKPLFEKLNYRYLGAQKEADFIYKQFRIGGIIADYDNKRELLAGYCEVTNSINTNKNAKIINCIGILFTFIAGWDRLLNISHILFDDKNTVEWNIDLIIPIGVFLIIIGIIIKIIEPIKAFKSYAKK